jgi:hypothetical protein
MNPSVWGNHAWIFLHSITMAYPTCPTENDKYNMKNFFMAIMDVLPCPTCKDNYKNHILELPLTDKILGSKDLLVKWLIDFHNLVNKQNGKRQLSYDEVQDNYANMYGYNTKHKIFRFYIILFIFIIIITLISVVFWNKIK